MTSSLYIESSQYRSLKKEATADYLEPYVPFHCNLISFLSVAQRLEVNLIPFLWNALDVGRGATAQVSHSALDMEIEYAFKRTSKLFAKDPEEAFRAIMTEILVLANPSVRNHQNIVNIEGVCWEFDDDKNLLPVLVLPKAQKGNLTQHLLLLEESENTFGSRQKLCLDIGKAIASLHGACM